MCARHTLQVIEAAEKLCTLDHLDLYFKDAYSFLKERRGAQVVSDSGFHRCGNKLILALVLFFCRI